MALKFNAIFFAFILTSFLATWRTSSTLRTYSGREWIERNAVLSVTAWFVHTFTCEQQNLQQNAAHVSSSGITYSLRNHTRTHSPNPHSSHPLLSPVRCDVTHETRDARRAAGVLACAVGGSFNGRTSRIGRLPPRNRI